MAVELFKSSINSLIKGFSQPTQQEFNLISLTILILAILVKIYMYFYNHSIGKKINSVSLEATAKDSLSDTISTLVVIVSMVLGQFTTFPVDGIAGLVVSVFIFLAGYEAAKETLQPLLGSKPEEDFVKEIEAAVLEHKPIVGIHDLVVHDYGPGRKMISLHAEVPGDMDIFELHDVIDVTEVDVATKFGCETVIHLDPIDLKNPQLAKNKEIVSEIVQSIDEKLTIHDFRMVPGETHTNLIFDVVKPFECKISDSEMLSTIREKVLEKLPNHFCVIAVDRPYC
jgi:cation diffusion facilitator family transporter